MKIASPIPRRRPRIVMIPLIDIMFFLLASFMMISLQMDKTQNVKVNLPSATQARHDFKPDMVNIAVDKSGAVWVEKKPATLPELGLILSNRLRLETNAPVFISGDRDTLEGKMAQVLDVIRRSGVQKVAFTVDGAESSTNR